MAIRENDIIVASATPLVPSAIGIIRLSGKGSLDLIKKWVDIDNIKPRYVYLRDFKDEDKLIDEVQIVWYEEGKSYTGEEMVEIFTHGSPIGMNYIMNLMIKNGARLANAGEFSFRSLLNGKMSPIKAESINAIINAVDENTYFSSLNSVNKDIEFVENIKREILDLMSYIEVGIDFPDEDIPLQKEEIVKRLDGIIAKLEKAIDNTKKYVKISDGIRITIAGLPNVGKSTIFNLILKEDRAIVYDKPGTTRDRISENILLNGIRYQLNDTAGLRTAEDDIEKMGIEKTEEYLSNSHIVLFITDVSKEWTEEEKSFIEEIKNKGIVLCIIGNKADKGIAKDNTDIVVSGIDEKYRDKIIDLIIKRSQNILPVFNEIFFINQRQLGMLEEIYVSLKKAKDMFEKEDYDYLEVVSLHIREGLFAIDRLNGRIVDDEYVLNNIFSHFCIGK